MQTALLILCVIILLILIVQSVLLWHLWQRPSGGDTAQELAKLEGAVNASQKASRETAGQIAAALREEQKAAFTAQNDRLRLLGEQTAGHLAESRTASDRLRTQTEERMRTFSEENARSLRELRQTVAEHLARLRQEQQKALGEMRTVVDEKMQQVLSERMKQAFSAVNERLEQVYKGLGEMQSLAGSVGDLKKLLTNVKTRGEVGEIQLEALLGDMLPEGQFVRNAKLGRGTVEFAVYLPDRDGSRSLLPIDAKFAGDTYLHLQEAYEGGDKQAIAQARRALVTRIRDEAKDIAAKYITPPQTTDYGILFLPTEGLYTEAVREGLTAELFRKHRVFVTGPTTMAAMLSTLQMGIQSIAVQQYSSEVWQVLGEVRTEFHKFAEALARTQDKLTSASDELEKLVGVRTRQMERRLSSVQSYFEQQEPAAHDIQGGTNP